MLAGMLFIAVLWGCFHGGVFIALTEGVNVHTSRLRGAAIAQYLFIALGFGVHLFLVAQSSSVPLVYSASAVGAFFTIFIYLALNLIWVICSKKNEDSVAIKGHESSRVGRFEKTGG